ncbi:MAG: hypothetical protein PF569_07750 [Candidatus Woesearchaeota archaeon]|jgi:hypothetical protein|nr:hypothetical protein [Candidatus Woesearchaeota archaeon]
MGGPIAKRNTIVDELKNKLIESAVAYAKDNIDNSKKEIANYIESRLKKNLEEKIRKEVKKYLYLSTSFLLFVVGALFLIYALIQILIHVLVLPNFIGNLIFSALLLLLGFILYIISK